LRIFFEKAEVMKKIMVFVAVVCFVLVGVVQKGVAGPVPISAQESSRLNELSGNNNLLNLKAGGSFPDAPRAMEAREESSLKDLEAGTPNLSHLKAGDGPGTVLVWVVVICVCVVLLRLVGIF
jgi:hypothetical protein